MYFQFLAIKMNYFHIYVCSELLFVLIRLVLKILEHQLLVLDRFIYVFLTMFLKSLFLILLFLVHFGLFPKYFQKNQSLFVSIIKISLRYSRFFYLKYNLTLFVIYTFINAINANLMMGIN